MNRNQKNLSVLLVGQACRPSVDWNKLSVVGGCEPLAEYCNPGDDTYCRGPLSTPPSALSVGRPILRALVRRRRLSQFAVKSSIAAASAAEGWRHPVDIPTLFIYSPLRTGGVSITCADAPNGQLHGTVEDDACACTFHVHGCTHRYRDCASSHSTAPIGQRQTYVHTYYIYIYIYIYIQALVLSGWLL